MILLRIFTTLFKFHLNIIVWWIGNLRACLSKMAIETRGAINLSFMKTL
jgi:hypothetical protein